MRRQHSILLSIVVISLLITGGLLWYNYHANVAVPADEYANEQPVRSEAEPYTKENSDGKYMHEQPKATSTADMSPPITIIEKLATRYLTFSYYEQHASTTSSTISMMSNNTSTGSAVVPEYIDEEKASVFNGVVYKAPFSPQAPFGNWADERQQDACEETSALMAISWARNHTLTKQQTLNIIEELAPWQGERFGTFVDTSADDTAVLIREYFGYNNVRVSYEVTTDAIKQALKGQSVVITPMNGQLLGNPYYSHPGPERHMLVVIGYDDDTQEFITNDPGTRRGEGYRYPYEVFINAIRDYPTGNELPITSVRRAMIVVGK